MTRALLVAVVLAGCGPGREVKIGDTCDAGVNGAGLSCLDSADGGEELSLLKCTDGVAREAYCPRCRLTPSIGAFECL